MTTFLVFSGTGGAGRHFISLALEQGHTVKAIVRTPSKLSPIQNPKLQVFQGSITDDPMPNLDECVRGSDYVVSMLGDKATQSHTKINTAFVQNQQAMRRHGVNRFLYQAGGFSKPYKESMPTMLWVLKYTVAYAAGYAGQHADNEAVMAYLCEEASDIEWIVHRVGIGGEGSRGVLRRSLSSDSKISVGTF